MVLELDPEVVVAKDFEIPLRRLTRPAPVAGEELPRDLPLAAAGQTYQARGVGGQERAGKEGRFRTEDWGLGTED